jgi:hypothetical protein
VQQAAGSASAVGGSSSAGVTAQQSWVASTGLGSPNIIAARALFHAAGRASGAGDTAGEATASASASGQAAGVGGGDAPGEMVRRASGTASAAGLASGVSNVEVIAIPTKDTFDAGRRAEFFRAASGDFRRGIATRDFVTTKRTFGG